jgi:RNA polymerase sigma factor (sigma-70 family)
VTPSSALEDLARLAIDGDRGALDLVVRELQPDIYGLSLRMLWNKEDAEDATQEILVRIVTRLSQFDFRSRLRTWAYRVAVNYVLDVKKSAIERLHLSFERFGDSLIETLAPPGGERADDAEQSLLIEEVKIGCTLAMLQCLDRPHRLAYVLGDIMELSGPEAAEALDISPELFRKRLQHARAAVVSFTKAHCGLVSDAAPCRCHRQVGSAVKAGRVDVQQLAFARSRSSFEEAKAQVRRVDEARWALEVHRTSHPRTSSVDFARRLIQTFDEPAG